MSKIFFIPGNTPSSKNSRVWTGKFFVVSVPVRRWRKVTKQYWVGQREDFLKGLSGLPKPYFIHLTFRRNSRRKFDYGNAAQVVQDEMVTYGWIEDDNADEIVPVFGKYIYDKDLPGVTIRVLREKPVYIF